MDDQRILAAVESKRAIALETHRFVHEHAELSHEEYACSGYLCELFQSAGLEVERGLGGMATAFRVTLRGSRPGRSVGLVALYDAVPVFRPDGTIEPVHSCGTRLPQVCRTVLLHSGDGGATWTKTGAYVTAPDFVGRRTGFSLSSTALARATCPSVAMAAAPGSADRDFILALLH